MNLETEQSKPFTCTTLSSSALKSQDKLRPALSKHLETFMQRSAGRPSGQLEPILQTSQRWARQLLFLLRQ